MHAIQTVPEQLGAQASPRADGRAGEPLSAAALEQRVARERLARIEAERLLERKSLDLYNANQDLRRTAEELEQERSYLDAIFHTSLAALVLTDADSRIVRANRRAVRLFELDRPERADAVLVGILTGDCVAVEWLAKRVGPGAVFDETTCQGAVRQMSGDEVPVRISCGAIGLKELRIWSIRDIRRQLAAEQARVALEHELSQAQKMEALGTLASGVAHEINTPIQYVSDNTRFFQEVVDGAVELLRSCDKLRDQAREAGFAIELIEEIDETRARLDIEFLMNEAPASIEQSLQGLAQVATIVKAIKEFSHPGGADKAPVDVNSAVETTLTVSRNSWKYVAEVSTELEPNLPTIMGLQGDIHQVLINLIGNAADAIAERQPPEGGRIVIATRVEEGAVLLSVSDNGVGIDAKDAPRVFDPFFTTKEAGKGTGQGLAIVYNIVRVKHGGALALQSERGKGTTFTVRLPIIAPKVSA